MASRPGEAFAISTGSFARAVTFAMSQPQDVDVNEIFSGPRARSCRPEGAIFAELPNLQQSPV